MKRNAIIKIVLFTFLALLLTNFLVIVLTNDFDFNDWELIPKGEVTVVEYKYENVDSIDIDWNVDSVNVYPTKEKEILVKHTKTKRAHPLKIEQDGNSLSIKQKSNNMFLGFWSSKSSIDVYLPEIEYKKIDISVASGKVHIEEMKVKSAEIQARSGSIDITSIKADELTLNLASGKVELNNIDVKNKIKVEVLSGEMKGRDVKADYLEADVSSGSFSLNGAIKDFDIKGTSGKMDIINHVVPDRFTAKMSSGKMNISIPDNKGFKLKLSKSSGNFQTDFDMMISINDDSYYTYKNGDKTRREYEVKITSGKMTLNKTD